MPHTTSRLFDPDDLLPRGDGIYVALPMTGEREAQDSLNPKLLGDLEQTIRQVSATSTPGWDLHVLTGQQHSTPWGDGSDPIGARAWIRARFVRAVAGLVMVLHRESTGCGKELALALALGIPTLVLVPDGATPGIHVGSGPLEGHLEVKRLLPGSLRRLVAEWLTNNRDIIEGQRRRRQDWIGAGDALRRRLLQQWEQLADAQRDTVAGYAWMERHQLADLLQDPHEFAARVGPVMRAAEALGVLPGTVSKELELAHFETSELDALQQAVELYHWEPEQVVAAVGTACELRSLSGHMRGRLGSPRGWKRMLERERVRRGGQAS